MFCWLRSWYRISKTNSLSLIGVLYLLMFKKLFFPKSPFLFRCTSTKVFSCPPSELHVLSFYHPWFSLCILLSRGRSWICPNLWSVGFLFPFLSIPTFSKTFIPPSWNYVSTGVCSSLWKWTVVVYPCSEDIKCMNWKQNQLIPCWHFIKNLDLFVFS